MKPSASGLLVPHLLVGPARRKGRGRGDVKRQYQEWEFGNTIRGVGKIYISLSFKKKSVKVSALSSTEKLSIQLPVREEWGSRVM